MKFFMPDDYGEIEAKYFAELRRQGQVDADPSGWRGGRTDAEQWAPLPQLQPRDLVPYYIDEGDALAPHKESIAALLQAWDGYGIELDQFTLCTSGASASLITLATLKNLGVRRVVFETPSYFGSIDQANQIGLSCELVPTYRREGYAMPSLDHWIGGGESTAIWLTQPRASLGFNQSVHLLDTLLECLPATSYLIIDEATDQSFPIHLGAFAQKQQKANLIRIRSFTKGMGLNGLRLAAIIHSASLRASIVHCLEFFGSSVDAHSLSAVASLAADMGRFTMMLRAANDQVNSLRARTERLVMGSPLAVNPLTNGYIGTVIADLTALGRSHESRRVRLLEGCRHVRTPVMLGASSYVAIDHPTEAIRLNFFRPPDDLLRGVANILNIWQAS
jgi:histidinol-phosphate/aromatic aminotransferase/cobyric acid decarboxylase-like protein